MQKNRIIDELKKRRHLEECEGEILPVPAYLYIRSFGRSPAVDFDRIKEAGGYREGFVFPVEGVGCRNLLEEFQLKVHAVIKPGKKIKGLVLVDIREDVNPYEFKKLLSFLDGLPELHFIFALEENGKRQIRDLLERYFFVRLVNGEAFDAEEQLEILKDEFEKYHFTVENKSAKWLEVYLQTVEWKPQEPVERRLRNIARWIVYEMAITAKGRIEEKERIIRMPQAEEIADRLKDVTGGKYTFGF